MVGMFRIVQFKIDYEKLIAIAESRRTTVEAIQNYTRIEHVGNDFLTEPMATTERRYFDIEACLRSLWGDRFNWDVIDLTDKYRLLRTRAPQAYDYGYCIEVGVMPFRPEKNETEKHTERLIAMPIESVEYQSGRYSSGMYTPIDCS